MFTVSPSNTQAGQLLSVEVTIEDRFGRINEASDSVTVAIASNPGGAVLAGTRSRQAAGGVASFTDLSLGRPGPGYVLVATATSINAGVSAPFDILAFSALSGGNVHACGVTPAGSAYCWGLSSDGELGAGNTPSNGTPVAVAGGLTFATVSAGDAVDAGGQHTCGVTRAGVAYCWGYNGYGGLGNGTTTSSNVPVPVSGGLAFTSISAGAGHTCGVTLRGAAFCWGDNAFGQLGNGDTTTSTTPVAVSGGIVFASVDVGKFDHTCGLTPLGVAYCWGYNGTGQLGYGTTTLFSPTPGAVSGGLTFATLSVGADHTCGVTPAGTAYCWGYGSDGELGNGANSTASSASPVAVSGGLVFTALSAGGFHTCGIARAGMAYCWGWNPNGELGNGTFTSSGVPVAVSGALAFGAVSAGNLFTCALTLATTTYCWGHNAYGELGNRTTVGSNVPVVLAP